MTFENQKKLYDHLMEIGRIEDAKAIAYARPEVANKPKPVEEPPKKAKSKKSK